MQIGLRRLVAVRLSPMCSTFEAGQVAAVAAVAAVATVAPDAEYVLPDMCRGLSGSNRRNSAEGKRCHGSK